SSPNTPGLRQLQDKNALDELLAALAEEAEVLQRKTGEDNQAASLNSKRPHPPSPNAPSPKNKPRKPILVKIAPDLEPQALDQLLEVCKRRGVDGLIATNTTLSRDGLNTT